METMEREFAAFKQRMEGEASNASDLKETIKVLQSRGIYHPFHSLVDVSL
jgi:kinesin family protein C1